jgi:DNA-binding FadR family transcriptional regulator
MRSLSRPHTRSVLSAPAFQEAIIKWSIRDVISDKIVSMIASGVIGVGDSLPSERDLAAALNVSRESVRGAVQNLATRGILEISHGARTRVVKADVSLLRMGGGNIQAVDDYDLDTVHSARMFVEREIVADAARRIDGATLAILETLLAAQRTAVDDPIRFLISDREFHFVIYHAASNVLLADFASDLYAFMLNYRRKAVARPGAIPISIKEHEAIFAAFKKRDGDAAIAAFGRHTERIYCTTREVLGIHPTSGTFASSRTEAARASPKNQRAFNQGNVEE